jgi:Flp pilus assembly pilin Flp
MFFCQFFAMLFDEHGQGLVEYALVIALVALVAVASLRYFGTRTNNQLYGSISNAMNTVP